MVNVYRKGHPHGSKAPGRNPNVVPKKRRHIRNAKQKELQRKKMEENELDSRCNDAGPIKLDIPYMVKIDFEKNIDLSTSSKEMEKWMRFRMRGPNI